MLSFAKATEQNATLTRRKKMLQNMVKNLFGLFFGYCILASSHLDKYCPQSTILSSF
jgi:hypothetical protein